MPAPAAWALTMIFVISGWVLFRATSFAEATSVLQSMFALNGVSLETAKYGAPWYIVPIGAAIALIGPSSQDVALERNYDRPWAAFVTASAFVICVILVGSGDHPEFIYFQF